MTIGKKHLQPRSLTFGFRTQLDRSPIGIDQDLVATANL